MAAMVRRRASCAAWPDFVVEVCRWTVCRTVEFHSPCHAITHDFCSPAERRFAPALPRAAVGSSASPRCRTGKCANTVGSVVAARRRRSHAGRVATDSALLRDTCCALPQRQARYDRHHHARASDDRRGHLDAGQHPPASRHSRGPEATRRSPHAEWCGGGLAGELDAGGAVDQLQPAQHRDRLQPDGHGTGVPAGHGGFPAAVAAERGRGPGTVGESGRHADDHRMVQEGAGHTVRGWGDAVAVSRIRGPRQ